MKIINVPKSQEYKKYQPQTENLVINAIKSPQIINFEELLLLDAVKDLKKQSKDLLQLLDLFLNKDMEQFKTELAKVQALLERHSVT